MKAITRFFLAVISQFCISGVMETEGSENPLNIFMTGFSESMFHILSGASGGSLSRKVEEMDKKHKITGPAVHSKNLVPLPPSLTPKDLTAWKRIKIFISSTFIDMHGERNLMNYYLFPELSRRAKTLGIEIIPVDLRWGVHETISAEKQVQTCLDEIDKCDFFVGVLGERYGWKPPIENSLMIKSRLESHGCSNLPLGEVSITELEIEYGVLSRRDARKNAFFFIRDHTSIEESVPKEMFETEDSVDKERLNKLKNRVKTSGYEVLDGYPCRFSCSNGTPMTHGLEDFGRVLFENLWNAISASQKPKEKFPETELEKHSNFCKTVASSFVGRKKQLEVVKEVFNKPNATGVIEITGKDGIGKSSFLAKLAFNLMKTQKSAQTLIVPYFPEAVSQGKLKMLSLLAYIKKVLQTHLGLTNDDNTAILPGQTNLKSLTKDVYILLQNAADLCNIQIMLLIDGLDSSDDLTFNWIPSTLSQRLSIIFSTDQRGKLTKWISSRKDKLKKIQIEPLSLTERNEMAQNILKSYGKSLKTEAFDNQLNLLISKREAGNPTYLKLLCIEMAKFGVFEEVSSHLADLGESMTDLLDDILIRVEGDVGKQVLQEFSCLLAAAGDYGLTETELIKLLNILPGQTFMSLLLNGLHTFLIIENGSVKLREGKSRDALLDKFTSGKEISEACLKIANCLSKEYENSEVVDSMLLEALPFHLATLKDVKRLEQLICSFKFIQLSALTERLFRNLLMHFKGVYLSSKVLRERFLSSEKIQKFNKFINKHQDNIQNQPCLLLQIAMNDPIIRNEMKPETLEELQNPSTFLITDKPEIDNLINFRESQVDITACAIEKSESIEGEFLLNAQGFADGSINLSLAQSGIQLFNLIGHSSAITALAFIAGSKSSGDSFLVSGSEDGEISFWDLNMRIRLKSFKAHSRRVSAVVSSLDGLTVVSVGWDGGCKVWSGRSHRELSSLKQATFPYNCVAYHPEKDYIVTGDWKGLVKVYNLTSKERKAVLRGHQGSVQDVVISTDGRKIASVDITGLVCVFEGMLCLNLQGD